LDLKEKAVKHSDELEDKGMEIRLVTRRLERVTAALSSLQAQVFRLVKAHPETAEYITDSDSPLLQGLQNRTKLPTLADAAEETETAADTFSLSDPIIRKEGSICPVHAARHHLSAPREVATDSENTWKFSMFLEECSDQLEQKIDGVSRLYETNVPQTTTTDTSKTPTKQPKRIPRKLNPKQKLQMDRLYQSKSLFVGHGLGLKKPPLSKVEPKSHK
jgi:hypothetical protein